MIIKSSNFKNHKGLHKRINNVVKGNPTVNYDVISSFLN